MSKETYPGLFHGYVARGIDIDSVFCRSSAPGRFGSELWNKDWNMILISYKERKIWLSNSIEFIKTKKVFDFERIQQELQ